MPTKYMKCKWCETKIHNIDGHDECDNCWEMRVRIERYPNRATDMLMGTTKLSSSTIWDRLDIAALAQKTVNITNMQHCASTNIQTIAGYIKTAIKLSKIAPLDIYDVSKTMCTGLPDGIEVATLLNMLLMDVKMYKLERWVDNVLKDK